MAKLLLLLTISAAKNHLDPSGSTVMTIWAGLKAVPKPFGEKRQLLFVILEKKLLLSFSLNRFYCPKVCMRHDCCESVRLSLLKLGKEEGKAPGALTARKG